MVRRSILAAVTLAVLLLPLAAPPIVESWEFRLATLVALTASWNLMANAGLISLGHVGFWACGGYAAMITLNANGWAWGFWLLPAMLVGSLLGAFLAAITGRLRGIYFAIATLALAEGLRVLTLMLPSLTRGAQGIHLDRAYAPVQRWLEVGGTGFAIAALLLIWQLGRGRFHFASRALRNNEDAAQMLGIDPRVFRMATMAISGAIAAGAGGFNAVYSGYIDPTVAFSLQYTILPQIAAVLGGLYSLPGSALGPAIILALSEGTRLLAGTVPGVGLLLLGALLVVCVLFMPAGLAGVFAGRPGRAPLATRLLRLVRP